MTQMPAIAKHTGNVSVGSRNCQPPSSSGGIAEKPIGPPVTSTQLRATWRQISPTAKVAITKNAARSRSVIRPMTYAATKPPAAAPTSPTAIGSSQVVVSHADQ